jgi:hypothetical protein
MVVISVLLPSGVAARINYHYADELVNSLHCCHIRCELIRAVLAGLPGRTRADELVYSRHSRHISRQLIRAAVVDPREPSGAYR